MGSRRRTKTIAAATRLLCAGLLTAACVCASRAEPGAAPSWNRSGRKVALASLERGTAHAFPGRFSWLCSSREVRALAIERDTLWIGTEGGLFAMSLSLDIIEPVNGPASISIRDVALEKGALWIAGDHSISSRSGGRWRHYTAEANPLFERVRCFAPGEGRLWIGAFGAGMGYVAGDAATFISCADAGIDRRVLAIAEQTPTTIFLGTASGLMIADTSGWRSLRYGSRLPIGPVASLAFGEDGDLFCSIPGQGTAIYSFGRVRTFGAGPGTPGTRVRAFSLDPSSRRMWAAGDDGAFIYDGTEWKAPLSGAAGVRRRFLSMKHDGEGNCYLGTDDGAVVIVSRGGAREVRVPQAFPEHRVARLLAAGAAVWCIAGNDVFSGRGSFVPAARPPDLYAGEMNDLLPLESGEIWLATRFGILRAVGKTWEPIDRRNGLATEYFIRAARDPAGTLWFASADAGVASYRSGEWASHSRVNGLPSNEIADLVVDGAGRPWIVTRSGDVARFAEGIWARMPLPPAAEKPAAPADSAEARGRYDPAIRFLPDAGRDPAAASAEGGYRLGLDRARACIVATEAGVYRSGGGGFSLVKIPERLRGARPTAILESSRGELWLGTAGGGILVHRAGEWFRITASNGLSDDYVRSICEDAGGALWIGTQAGGITKYTPAAGR
jgi:ligand-binding sensor domain-containing protein